MFGRDSVFSCSCSLARTLSVGVGDDGLMPTDRQVVSYETVLVIQFLNLEIRVQTFCSGREASKNGAQERRRRRRNNQKNKQIKTTESKLMASSQTHRLLILFHDNKRHEKWIREIIMKTQTPGRLGSAHPMPQEMMPARNHLPSSP